MLRLDGLLPMLARQLGRSLEGLLRLLGEPLDSHEESLPAAFAGQTATRILAPCRNYLSSRRCGSAWALGSRASSSPPPRWRQERLTCSATRWRNSCASYLHGGSPPS